MSETCLELLTAIFSNFPSQLQVNPTAGSSDAKVFASLDLFFTVVFVVELAINLFSNWFWPFMGDAWQIFDLVVVSVSIVSLADDDTIPGMHRP